MPGSPEILLGTATFFEYSRSYFSCNIRCDHDVIDTYLSLRYICYNYCGHVYIKLTLDLKRCGSCGNGNHRACLLQVEIRLYMSHFSRISWSLCNSRELCPLKIAVIHSLKEYIMENNSLEIPIHLRIVTHRVNFPWFSTLFHAASNIIE